MKNNKVIIVGAFSEIIELCETIGINIVGIFDNIRTKSFMGYRILGDDKLAFSESKKYNDIPIIVTPDNPEIRKQIVINYREAGYKFLTLIHNNANISKYARIGEGVVIQNGANISSNTIIGDFVKINTSANITHDCRIGNYTTIAPNAVILGRVKIKENCYIGSNSTILSSIRITANTIIGAGAVVTKNIEEGNKVFIGVPARELN